MLERPAPAHGYLAELKGLASTIPNEPILFDTLALQEAKNRSEIDSIIITRADFYKADRLNNLFRHPYYINFPLMRVFTDIPHQPGEFEVAPVDSK